MSQLETPVVDIVRELRLRQWARQNFVSIELRPTTWHPIVLHEMRLRDDEISLEAASATSAVRLDVQNEIQSAAFDGSADLSRDDLREQGNSAVLSYVPLAPTIDWRLDSGTSQISRPHFQIERKALSNLTATTRTTQYH